MASADEVRAEVARQVDDGGFVSRLGERLGLNARASAAFGDPVEQGGVTVVPVAKTTWGFGGGSGGEGVNTGSGGGGGGVVTPLGFIEVRSGEARFVPIHDLRVTPQRLVLAAGLAGLIAARLKR